MKTMKKLSLIFVMVLTVFVGLIKVSAANVTVGVETSVSYEGAAATAYIVQKNGHTFLLNQDGTDVSDFMWSKLKTSDGKVAYCYDYEKDWPQGDMVMTPVAVDTEKATGLAYILENGYPNKKIKDGGIQDRFITQGAVWMYAQNVKFDGYKDPEGLVSYMKSLVEGAKKAQANKSGSLEITVDKSSNDMTLSDDGKFYVSAPIAAKVSGTSTYTVSTSGVDGAVITDESGANKTSFTTGEKFVVKVPVAAGEGKKVKVVLTVKGSSYVVQPANEAYQPVIFLNTAENNKSEEFELTTVDKVCVEYVIVGNVIPDPKLTDPTPEKKCFNKNTPYDQEKKLTTKQENCTFKGWNTKSDLTGSWVDGTPLTKDEILYGAWNCTVKVPPTDAATPLIIAGVGLVAVAAGIGVYIYTSKKTKSEM